MSTKGRAYGPNKRTTNEIRLWTSVYLSDTLIERMTEYANAHGVTRSSIHRTATEIGMRYLERLAERTR